MIGGLEVPQSTVVMPGGADINPALYGAPNLSSYFSDSTDRYQLEVYNKAVAQGLPIFGICRGQQLIASQNGLTLIQDLNHPGRHTIKVKNLRTGKFDNEVQVNSIHHQMVWTENKLKGKTFKVLGYTHLSKKHTHHEDIDCQVEPEIMLFPKVNAITTQFHPEMMRPSYSRGNDNFDEVINYLQTVINKYWHRP